MTRTLLAFALAAAASIAPASAHHSFAAHYLEDERVSIEGDLVQLDYRSPHSWVYVNAKDQSGVVRRVSAEWASAPRSSAFICSRSRARRSFLKRSKSTRCCQSAPV